MKITRDVIAIIVVLAAVASLFFVVNQTGEELVRYLALLIAGFYFGRNEIPILGAIKTKTQKK